MQYHLSCPLYNKRFGKYITVMTEFGIYLKSLPELNLPENEFRLASNIISALDTIFDAIDSELELKYGDQHFHNVSRYLLIIIHDVFQDSIAFRRVVKTLNQMVNSRLKWLN
ncbi:hypothetical protein CKY06_08065 [Photorhabdus sp. S15-56]|nr:hypothetical protein CKY15_08570 [Photorhabdus sp. S7-51]RAW78495.1 hypothetical protein CKY06_08065 [Photorhabdus sp. S15-56]